MVEARRVGDRAVLLRRGPRHRHHRPTSCSDLNERLATPPLVDVAVSRMMGLVVVARLAARHGVKVELRPGPDRGTVADVTLPTSVLVPRALAGRQQRRVARASCRRRSASRSSRRSSRRSPFAAPLALESGPMTRSDRELAGRERRRSPVRSVAAPVTRRPPASAVRNGANAQRQRPLRPDAGLVRPDRCRARRATVPSDPFGSRPPRQRPGSCRSAVRPTAGRWRAR